VQDWVVTGLPPVQPTGDELVTVLVWVLLEAQDDQLEYPHEVQVTAACVVALAEAEATLSFPAAS